MSFDDELRGLSYSHAPAPSSDVIRLDLARESVRRLGSKIGQLTADVARLEADLSASTVSLGEYEKTRKELEKAITDARRNLSMYEMYERKLSEIISNT